MTQFVDQRLNPENFANIFEQLLDNPNCLFFREVYTSNLRGYIEEVDRYEISRKEANELYKTGEFVYDPRKATAFAAQKCIYTTCYLHPAYIKLDGKTWAHNEVIVFRSFQQFEDED